MRGCSRQVAGPCTSRRRSAPAAVSPRPRSGSVCLAPWCLRPQLPPSFLDTPLTPDRQLEREGEAEKDHRYWPHADPQRHCPAVQERFPDWCADQLAGACTHLGNDKIWRWGRTSDVHGAKRNRGQAVAHSRKGTHLLRPFFRGCVPNYTKKKTKNFTSQSPHPRQDHQSKRRQHVPAEDGLNRLVIYDLPGIAHAWMASSHFAASQ